MTLSKLTDFYSALNNGCIATVRHMLHDKTLANTNFFGQSPLHVILTAKRLDGTQPPMDIKSKIVTLLLEAGANPNARENVWNRTPLHLVVHEKIAAKLLFHGARVDALDDFNVTPLHCAIFPENLSLLAQLLAVKPKNAYPNIRSDLGLTPFSLLFRFNFEKWQEMALLLLQNGANINIPDNDGLTALDYVASKCDNDKQSFLRKYDKSNPTC